MKTSDNAGLRLTSYAHGGGCGCKLAPAVLEKIIRDLPRETGFPGLLVGIENGDDAAVYQLNDEQAVVATTDFFTPIVDDPVDFGRIAAANAVSDVYAMGARPIFALAVLGMPVGKLPPEVMAEILKGARLICTQAGIPIAGGHSIDTPEPIFGLVAVGIVHPKRIKTNSAGKPGDVLILGKPLGIGILSAALKKGVLSRADYDVMLHWTTKLNTPGLSLAEVPGVHAITDVTGFGLAGHLLEICRGSGLNARIDWSSLPLLPQAVELARAGSATGASTRNWESYGRDVVIPAHIEIWQRHLLCDPQTSGGLLVSCDPESAKQVLEIFHKEGFHEARQVGALLEAAGPPLLRKSSGAPGAAEGTELPRHNVTVNFSD